jgi:hypothetical protein
MDFSALYFILNRSSRDEFAQAKSMLGFYDGLWLYWMTENDKK